MLHIISKTRPWGRKLGSRLNHLRTTLENVVLSESIPARKHREALTLVGAGLETLAFESERAPSLRALGSAWLDRTIRILQVSARTISACLASECSTRQWVFEDLSYVAEQLEILVHELGALRRPPSAAALPVKVAA